MLNETYNHGYSTLLTAIERAKKEGFIIEFVSNEKGLKNTKSGKTYLPESICGLTMIRIDAPMSEADDQSILYLLKTVDNKKGWISDAYGMDANQELADHLNNIEKNFKYT